VQEDGPCRAKDNRAALVSPVYQGNSHTCLTRTLTFGSVPSARKSRPLNDCETSGLFFFAGGQGWLIRPTARRSRALTIRELRRSAKCLAMASVVVDRHGENVHRAARQRSLVHLGGQDTAAGGRGGRHNLICRQCVGPLARFNSRPEGPQQEACWPLRLFMIYVNSARPAEIAVCASPLCGPLGGGRLEMALGRQATAVSRRIKPARVTNRIDMLSAMCTSTTGSLRTRDTSWNLCSCQLRWAHFCLVVRRKTNDRGSIRS
jgi:hypothetical protein